MLAALFFVDKTITQSYVHTLILNFLILFRYLLMRYQCVRKGSDDYDA